jgi:hypothetical protein
LLSCYGPGDEFHHGNASGIDQIAKEVAQQFGLEVIPHHPKKQKWEGGYKERNKEIVHAVEYLIAVHSPNSTTGGTVWTYQYAVRKQRAVEWVELDA